MKSLTALLLFPFVIGAKELDGTYLPTNNPCPTPEEARAKMTVPEGYAVSCFAHEPMVQNPVAMTWDARGRLWLVEAYEYPEGSKLPAPFGGEAKNDQYQPLPPNTVPTENGARNTSKLPRDRVIILEDTDNNGEADKRTVFVEGLNLASAILCGDDGIYVGQQPHLIHFQDVDHDDKPDQWRVILTGFGREDTHELVNSFCWGPDGWLYMTHGVFTHSKVRRPGQPETEGFKFDAGIGRCRPLNREKEAPWEFEVFADGTSNPWGCDYDAAGNFFVSACVIDHFFHMAPGGIYVRQGGAPENPYAYEQLPSIVKHKHFRAAYAGVQIYQGGVYPKDTWGHAFIGNIHDNAIHEEILTPVGSTFKCEPRRDFLRANDGWFRPVSTQTGPDGNLWVMDWCDKYPCYQNAKANPDGVDRSYGRIWRVMHRTSETNPDPFRFQYSAPETSDQPSHVNVRESRVAKPVFSGLATKIQSRPTAKMDLAKVPTEQLVGQLENPNNWVRRMARRLLVERGDVETTKSSISKVSDNAPLPIKLECLYTMHGLGAANGPLLSKLLLNPDPAMRAWAARLTGESWRMPLTSADPSTVMALNANGENISKAIKRLMTLGKDQDLSVRHATAVALRQWTAGHLTVNQHTALTFNKRWGITRLLDIYDSIALDEWIDDPTAGIEFVNPADAPKPKQMKRQPADDLVAFAAWQAIQPINHHLDSANRILDRFTRASSICNQKAAIKYSRQLAERADPVELATILTTRFRPFPPPEMADCLEAILQVQETRVTKPAGDMSQRMASWLGSSDQRVKRTAEKLAILWGVSGSEEILRNILFDEGAAVEARLEALRLARSSNADLFRSAIGSIMTNELDRSPNLLVGVLKLVRDLPVDSKLVAWASKHWSRLDVSQRTALAESLVTRKQWLSDLLAAIETNAINPNLLPISIHRHFFRADDDAIRQRAAAVFGAYRDSSNDVKAIIAAKRKACLEGEPDLAAGKLLFTTTCAVCHTFHGGGQKVGPELIGSGRSNLDALLANVIDPNQIIGNGYENIIINTKDNRTLMGRVTEDAPSHVKLLAIGGAEQVVPRDQIAKLDNTKQSLMPMGFGGLPDDQFRNLIWYILAPPEEGPLTAEKKELLSTSIDAAPEKPKSPWRNIDWESVSLWNPAWKVNAPDFERTPLVLADYHGRKNVLLMHPFPDKKTPASLEFKGVARSKLTLSVAADDRGDWMLKVLVNGQPTKELVVDHEKPRWKEVVVDTSAHAGKEITVRLEGHATGWAWEFGYWSEVRWE